MMTKFAVQVSWGRNWEVRYAEAATAVDAIETIKADTPLNIRRWANFQIW